MRVCVGPTRFARQPPMKARLLIVAVLGTLLSGGAAAVVGAFRVGGASAQPRASAALGKPRTETFTVGGSCSGGETCPTSVSLLAEIDSSSDLKVVYTAPAAHCSDVAVKLFRDGAPDGMTPFVSPSGTSARTTVSWPNTGKSYELGYEGLGKVGGCNGGNLVLWGESSR